MSVRPYRLLSLLVLLLTTTAVFADPSTFDLAGPKIEVKITRAGRELPISQAPSLAPGDQLWIRTDFPAGQAAKYLLITCFLRGATNPPPDNWFTRVETWDKKVIADGVRITVPPDAQQAVLFLAPSTGGDFTTLRNAVKGRPGAFVRASQDLNAASFDRARFETYVAAIEKIPSDDTSDLKTESQNLARSLAIKINQDCFNRFAGNEIACLTSGQNAVVMDDGHSSLVAQLTSGDYADLAANVSYLPSMGGGAYSAYVGAVMDVIRITSTLHTAQYQYIPALALASGDDLNLKLNNPPSFHNPKSVIVIGLPAIQAAPMPPLHPVDANRIFCLCKPSLVLPVEGAPLIFSSQFAHALVLHISSPADLELPLLPDPAHGGFVLSAESQKEIAQLAGSEQVSGTVEGHWGFDTYTGPTFHLQPVPSAHWTAISADENKLVVGRDQNIDLTSDGAACIDSIKATTTDGKVVPATWTPATAAKPNMLSVKLALHDVTPGAMTLLVKQYGQSQPEKVSLDAYADPPSPQSLSFHYGDTQATLSGKGLESITSVQVDNLTFTPGDITGDKSTETLPLTLPAGATAANLKSGARQTAHIKLKDGRTLELSFTVQPPRPHLTLSSKNIQMQNASGQAAFYFSGNDDLPLTAKLTFFVTAQPPARFSRDEKIEIASPDNSLHTQLTFDDGSLVLEDAHTILASLNPMKAFGASAFGNLQFRATGSDGTGDWQPLVNLIRVPSLKSVTCPIQFDAACTLTGDNLYLIDSISSDPKFSAAGKTATVPINFAGSTLSVPRPNGTLLYLKLRDQPASIDTVSLPVLPSDQ